MSRGKGDFAREDENDRVLFGMIPYREALINSEVKRDYLITLSVNRRSSPKEIFK